MSRSRSSLQRRIDQFNVLAARLSQECGFALNANQESTLRSAFKTAVAIGCAIGYRETGDPAVRACRFCACTESNACVSPSLDPCHWVRQDVCSACAPAAQKLGLL